MPSVVSFTIAIRLPPPVHAGSILVHAPLPFQVFTHISGWTQGAEVRNLALSLGERAKAQFPSFLIGKEAEVRGPTAVSSERCGTRSAPLWRRGDRG